MEMVTDMDTDTLIRLAATIVADTETTSDPENVKGHHGRCLVPIVATLTILPVLVQAITLTQQTSGPGIQELRLR